MSLYIQNSITKMKIIFKLILLLIIATTINASDYCALQKQHCSTHKHIGCQRNTYNITSQWKEFQLIPLTSYMRAEILEYLNEYRNRIALGKIPGFKTAANLNIINWHWEFEHLMEESVMKAEHGKFYCVTTGMNMQKFKLYDCKYI